MEGNAETCFAQHREVVGTIAHCNGLLQIDLLNLCNELEQFGLASAIDYLSYIVASQFAIFVDFKFVGIDIVNAIFLLNIFAKESESTTQDGNLIAIFLQDIHHSVNSFGEWEVLRNFAHHLDIETLEQLTALGKRLLEVYFSTHCRFCDGCYFVIYAMLASQFVDYFSLNQCRIHIEADEATHTAVHIVGLERAVDIEAA